MMNNFYEDLKKYLDNTPQDKIVADWEKSVAFDKIGPTIEEFLNSSQQYYVYTNDPNSGCLENNNQMSPKFTSGFLFNYNLYRNAKSSLFNS
ncbi:MAG TPA: hypothetical protein DCS17_07940 [Flavobacterium sp.]|nr:hypothetical protein [Flavobacterium sp.]